MSRPSRLLHRTQGFQSQVMIGMVGIPRSIINRPISLPRPDRIDSKFTSFTCRSSYELSLQHAFQPPSFFTTQRPRPHYRHAATARPTVPASTPLEPSAIPYITTTFRRHPLSSCAFALDLRCTCPDDLHQPSSTSTSPCASIVVAA
ncbi:unnamed protein product [Zymoseptoria tritici ST99CH_3D7]|uniref:Uncharacterized protein n=1 Tax=Zymoseptoria tritici (strain ST99CH_3D7) TaxID=1276538 RepID=A0A1X7S0D5_ZYMT9|nr:unnamed protein product [Zymoseptoria tritici ST99CH_3D7]